MFGLRLYVRMGGGARDTGFIPSVYPLMIKDQDMVDSEVEGFWSFEGVEARLVEAWGFLRRMPDRERGWLRPGVMSLWRLITLTEREAREQYQIDSDDYHRDALPRPPGLRTVEVDRMSEALDWMRFVPERDRKLVGLAIAELERGAKQVPWRRLLAPMGLKLGVHGLRKRYSRAITAIVLGLNAAEKQGPRASSRTSFAE